MFRRPYIIAAIAALILSWMLWKPLLGRHPLGPLFAATSSDEDSFSEIHDRLDRRLPEINFHDNPLADVIDFLRDVSGSNIFVNWRELKAAGVGPDAPVSLNLKDVRSSKALSQVLEGVSNGRAPLDSVTEDGFIFVSTRAEVDRGIVPHLYDLRPIFRQPGADPAPELIDQIATRFAPAIPIYHYPGTGDIIVLQTREQHRRIAHYLAWRQWLPGAQTFAIRTVSLLLGMLLVTRLLLIPVRRGRLRLEQGCCRVCGYDLRATLERCPECGAVSGAEIG